MEGFIQFFAIHFRWNEEDTLSLTVSRRAKLFKNQIEYVKKVKSMTT